MDHVELIRTLREAGLAVPIHPAEVQYLRRPGTPRQPLLEHDPNRPVAVRTHVEPADFDPVRFYRRRPTPGVAVLLLTVGRDEPGEPLWFGVAALVAEGRPGMVERWLFHADDAPPREVETLRGIAAAHGWGEPVSRRVFGEKVLWRYGWKGRAALVGWHLPVDLTRLAVDWAAATGRNRGGWSLILHTYAGEPTGKRPRLRNGEVENGFRPRYLVWAIDGVRALVTVARPRQTDPADRGGHRAAWSVQALAEAQSGSAFASLAEAAAVYGIRYGPRLGGASLTDLVADAIADLGVLAELHRRTLQVHRWLIPNRPPHAAMSPGSYAKGLLGRMRLDPPLARQSDFARPILAGFMAAFYAGDVAVGVRAFDLPVRHLDIGGAYGVTAMHCDVFGLLAAKRVRVYEADPQATRRHLERVARRIVRWVRNPQPDRTPLGARDWRQLARTLAWVRADGDVLPHRVLIRGTWRMTIGPLTWPEPLPYTLADLLCSALATGAIPRIERVIRISPWGRQLARGVPLPTGRTVAQGQDPIGVLAFERARLETDPTLPPVTRSLLRGLFKGIINSMASGITVQVLDDEPTAKRRPQDVWDPATGEQEQQKVTVIETPGEWYFPPAAAGVTACARLLLRLTRMTVEARGGTVAYWDTDSVMVVATPDGGFIPMPGGPLQTPDGQEAIRALSFREVEQARWKMETLSPYPDNLQPGLNVFDPETGHPVRVRQPRLLKIEPENQPPPGTLGLPRTGLLANVVAAKKYDPWWRTEPGDHVEIHDGQPAIVPPTAEQLRLLSRVSVVGASRHGIPHQPPDRADPNRWVEKMTAALIARQADLPPKEPPWMYEPAITLIPATRPTITRLHPKARSYSRLAVLSAFLGTGRAVTAWHPSMNPLKAEWRDLETRSRARPLTRDRTGVTGMGGFIGDTFGTVVARLRRTAERTALTADETPCGPRTRGVLHPAPTTATGVALIGKESRRWRDGRGILEPAEHPTYRQADNWPLTVQTLRTAASQIGHDPLATRIGISPRTLRYLLVGRAPLAATRAKVIRALPGAGGRGTQSGRFRICEACGKPFAVGHRRQRYCNPACKQRAHRLRQAESASDRAGAAGLSV